VALEAVAEMVRQKGFLAPPDPDAACARRGVLVRHLILPGQIENSLDALTTLFLEFGPGLPLSLMSQYTPVLPQEILDLNRPLTREAFERVYAHALDLGFEHLYVQFPRPASGDRSEGVPFLPDFRREKPFALERPAIDIPKGDC
jgi:putative pyruvate formate lyase activating enzyme